VVDINELVQANEIKRVKIEDVVPYINNPKQHPEKQIKNIASSIKNFKFRQPILIDEEGEIITGHGRYWAAQQLGLEEVPAIIVDDMTEEDKKGYRIADNKVAESEWDEELLKVELDGLEAFSGFEDDELAALYDEDLTEPESRYTRKVDAPQYEITGEQPELKELYSEEKYLKLLDEIEASEVTEEQKEFLKKAATRHLVFNYGDIAEYYAHASPEMQELMEKSALVVIDIDNAIRDGYVQIREAIAEILDQEDEL